MGQDVVTAPALAGDGWSSVDGAHVAVGTRERRLTQAANRRHGRDPYAADLHAFWVYQERVRPNAD